MRARRPRTATIGLAVFALLFAAATPVAAIGRPEPAGHGEEDLASDSWIVTLSDDVGPGAAAEMARAAGGRLGHVYRHALTGFQLLGSAQAAAALERNPLVVSVQADAALHLTETLPFGVQRVSAYVQDGTGAYQHGFRGTGARIAILDTGIDLDHPELEASIDHELGIHCVNTAFTPNDGIGHGTHVAGTAAAPINGIGVVGVAPEARLVAVKMFNDSGQSSEAIALCALDHIVGLNLDGDPSNDIDVANMSWGEQRAWGDCASDALHGGICAAHAAGIILVAGSGNSATDGGTFVPAAYPEVISVSALADFDGEPGGQAGCGFVLELFAQECDDTLAFFSNHTTVDIMAPGVMIYSSWVGGGWRTSSGTSMSTPHIAGIAALMAAAASGLSPAAARTALLSTGECPNGAAADADGISGCVGQGTWPDDPDGTPEPLGHALRAVEAVAGAPPPDPEPPSAPTLSATAAEGSVELSWTAPADDGGAPVTGYEVYRGEAAGTATLLATVGPTLSHTDSTVVGGTTYWYQVAAVNSAGVGSRSNEVSATPPAPPPPPEPPSAPALSATAGDGSVALSWTAPADDGGAPVTAYEVYRGASPGSATLLATIGDALAYTDGSALNGTTYWYQVAAVNSAGVGTRSNEVSATPQAAPTAPSAPIGLAAKKGVAGITLTWSAPASSGGSAITAYRIHRSTAAGTETFLEEVSASQRSFLDDSVARRTMYYYVVTAVNAIDEGPRSNEVSVRSR